MDGNAAMNAFIAKVRALKSLARETAMIAAPLIQDVLRASATAGTAPDGTPWRPKKDGSGRALEHAGDAIKVTADGETVRARIGPPYVFHQYGTSRDPKRQILPDGGAALPPRLADAIQRAARAAFAKTMGGR